MVLKFPLTSAALTNGKQRYSLSCCCPVLPPAGPARGNGAFEAGLFPARFGLGPPVAGGPVP